MGSPSPRSLRRRAPRRAGARTRAALAAASIPVVVVALTSTASPASAELPALPEVTPQYFKEAADTAIEYADGYYVVQLASDPIATYEGGESGLDATAPDEGDTIDFATSAVEEYGDFLAAERADVIAEYDVDALVEYDTVLNGFGAHLTAAEAEELAASDDVLAVIPDVIYEPTGAVDTTKFINVAGKKGAWEEEFGSHKRAGEGVIVGVLDTGIWPENPSLAPLSTPRPDQATIDAKWNGECETGEDEDPAANIECNNKLIGARWFDARGVSVDSYASPRDSNGHGTHTATTAAGNYGTKVVIDGKNVGKFSGLAPAARVAAYKVCWGGCSGLDLVAGIEAAVNDGVDVINFSIGSTGTPEFLDSVSIAFFNASAAGVFVAASAGNDGPTSTVDHQEPWVTTVAASSHDRTFRTELEFGNEDIEVAGLVGKAKWYVKNAVDAAYDDADPEAAARCDAGTLDPAKTEDFAIICVRGNLFTDNANQVADAGGVALIVVDQFERGPAVTVTSQAVPVISVSYTDGQDLQAWVDSKKNPRVKVETSELEGQNAPTMADFSSNGPALSAEQNLLKPDITAPGMEILAGITPENHAGNDFATNQGTSMSSPHVAGLAALLIGKHPGWKPMWVKSALMTTARQTDNRGKPIQRAGKDATPLDFGAGHVNPEAAFDPGLVYDSDAAAWVAYMCAIGQGRLVEAPCGDVAEIDPSDLNTPSIAVGDLAGVQTVTRTVTNPGKRAGVYRAKVVAPPGTKVTVTPSRLVVPPRSSKTFKVRIERTDAPFDDYTFGSLTWKSLSHSGADVRSPIVIRPVAVAAPPTVAGSGASGSTEIELKAGYSGTLNAEVDGLVAAEETTLELSDPTRESFDIENPTTGPHTGKVTVTVPEGAALARFATFAADYADLGPGTDLDLFVYRKGANGLELVDLSASGGSDEAVTLGEPGEYEIYVDLWSSPDGVTSLTARHYHWVVAGEEGNVTVEPTTQEVAIGEPASVTATWEGLTEGVRYLGVVRYGDAQSTRTQTVLEITG